MTLGRVRTVMSFVANPGDAARFWSGVLDAPRHAQLPLVDTGEVKLFFHSADRQRNPQGGTVAYFAVDDLARAGEVLLASGCVMHRGPLTLADRRRICQLRDPFGTIWGLEEV